MTANVPLTGPPNDECQVLMRRREPSTGPESVIAAVAALVAAAAPSPACTGLYSASSAAAVTLSRNPPRRIYWITSSERRSRCSQSSPGRGSNHRQRPIRCACRLRHRPEQARGSIHRFAGPSADHLPDLSLSALAAASSVFSFPLLKRSPRGQLLPSGPAGTAVAGPGSLP